MKYTKIWANSSGEKNEIKWERPKNDKWGKYVVDDSNFIPMSEQVKQIAKMQPIGNDRIEMIYDFPNGKDKGGKVPFYRTKNGKGMAELSQHLRSETNDFNNKVAKIKKEAVEKTIRDIKYQKATE